MELDPTQEIAVRLMCEEPISVVTGVPGSGKTSVTKEALAEFHKAGLTYALCAPTGKAARRLSEVTERPAQTIHRLLEFSYEAGGFVRNRSNPLDVDMVITDESSMIPLQLARSLLQAVDANRTRICFVGDANQLPPVGPGAFFRDMIDSKVVPTQWLTKVHRAAEKSWVYRNAPKILAGKEPELDDCEDFEWHQFGHDQGAFIGQAVLDLIKTHKLENTDTQVLTPMNKRVGGVTELNGMLQSHLNPGDGYGWEVNNHVLRGGDRVIQTKNNYKLGVFNGEVGTVGRVDKHEMHVNYEGNWVVYDHASAYDMQLAYAITVHKCVAPDTLVETPAGLQRIADIGTRGSIATPTGAQQYNGLFTKPAGKLLRITTTDGYSLTVSPEHGMMAWGVAGYTRTAAADLQPGTFLRLALGSTIEPPAPQLPAAPTAKELDVRTYRYVTPRVLTEDFAEFLGLMVADGTVFKRGFRLVKRHEDVVARFSQLCLRLFGVRATVSRHGSNATGATVNSTMLSQWLLQLGGLDPKAKAVPSCIMAAPLQMQQAFLRGLFEDGTVNVRGKMVDHVEWSTVYPELANVVQVMLLRSGIISSRKLRRGKPQTMLYIYGTQARLFRDAIGFVSAFKQQRLHAGGYGREQRYSIPFVKGRVSWRYDKNAARLGWISREKARSLPDFEEDLRWHHSRIAKIEETAGESMCVTVPVGGRFLQNGFDGCNSQGGQYQNVVVVCHSDHSIMLTRQLLYTAITRAKERVFLVGDEGGLQLALRTTKDITRKTLLKQRILGQPHG